MIFIPTKIPDVVRIEPRVFGDQRGFFLETYTTQSFADAGISDIFVQDNHSGSQKGTLRGLHYQIKYPQGKLVRAIVGEIFDVVVDLRQKSPTFGEWVGVTLTSENKNQLWVPPGFAHGFYVLSEWAEITYKVTDKYAPQWERTLMWNDPIVNVGWPIMFNDSPILSEKDQQGQFLSDAELFD